MNVSYIYPPLLERTGKRMKILRISNKAAKTFGVHLITLEKNCLFNGFLNLSVYGLMRRLELITVQEFRSICQL